MTTSTHYPQKVFDLLTEPDFREYLRLCYKSTDGTLEDFYEELKELGEKTIDYVDLLYIVASKDLYHLNGGQLNLFNQEETERYPQKLFNHLANPDFREYLFLCYLDCWQTKTLEGFYQQLKLETIEEIKEFVKELGDKTTDYVDLLYTVVNKDPYFTNSKRQK